MIILKSFQCKKNLRMSFWSVCTFKFLNLVSLLFEALFTTAVISVKHAFPLFPPCIHPDADANILRSTHTHKVHYKNACTATEQSDKNKRSRLNFNANWTEAI